MVFAIKEFEIKNIEITLIHCYLDFLVIINPVDYFLKILIKCIACKSTLNLKIEIK